MTSHETSLRQDSRADAREAGLYETAARLSDADIERAILRLVLYFDVFGHPLTIAELTRFVAPSRQDAVEAAAARLVSAGRLEAQGRYRTRPGALAGVARREERARHAERMWPMARRAASLLSSLPFVRGVLITGGLSKGSAAPDADVDFLLLVEPGRVWTLKSALQGVRRLLPGRGRELLCTNYLLDTAHLQVDDRNLFTAIELATAIPMAGPEACAALIDANTWATAHVPGLSWSRERATHAAPLRPRVAAPIEKLWEGAGAARAEEAALRLWGAFWDRKYAWLDDAVRAQRFKRRAEISTNHLHDFQAYVLREVGTRLTQAGLSADDLGEPGAAAGAPGDA